LKSFAANNKQFYEDDGATFSGGLSEESPEEQSEADKKENTQNDHSQKNQENSESVTYEAKV